MTAKNTPTKAMARALGAAYADSLTATTNDFDCCTNPGLVRLIGGCDRWEDTPAKSPEDLTEQIYGLLDNEFGVHGFSAKAWRLKARQDLEMSAAISGDVDYFSKSLRAQMDKAAEQMHALGLALKQGLDEYVRLGIMEFCKGDGACLIEQQ